MARTIKWCSAALSILTIAALTVAGAQAKDQNDDDILFEAAQKRFKLKGVVAKKEGKERPLDVAANELKLSYISVLKSHLAAQKLKQDPGSLAKATRSLLAKNPRVVRLDQKGATSRHALLRNTTGCKYRDGAKFTLPYNELSQKLCMDMTFDYPGGFDETQPLEVVVLPFFKREDIPELVAEWDAMVAEQFKRAVAKEFVAKYKQDGRLTL